MTKRKSDQTVEAFSISLDLLHAAGRRAKAMEMSKSGFYRYCLAKELGYAEQDARAFAEHRALVNLREEGHYPQARQPGVIMNEDAASSAAADARKASLGAGVAKVLNAHPALPPSPGVDAPSVERSRPKRGSARHSKPPPSAQAQTQAEPKAGEE